MEDLTPRFARHRLTKELAMRAAITTTRTEYPVLNAIAALVVRAATRSIRFYQTRSAMTRLMALSDHELRDIGLNRGDLISVSGTGDADPTLALARMVQERRRWRRGG
jgi:uncharacterized protein YjiS (DUF1127 family)